MSTENLHIELCFVYNKHIFVCSLVTGQKMFWLWIFLFVMCGYLLVVLILRQFVDQSIFGCMTMSVHSSVYLIELNIFFLLSDHMIIFYHDNYVTFLPCLCLPFRLILNLVLHINIRSSLFFSVWKISILYIDFCK